MVNNVISNTNDSPSLFSPEELQRISAQQTTGHLTQIDFMKTKSVFPKREDKELRRSYIEKVFSTGKLLIHGDNLCALSLLQENSEIRGKVRLVYIDPPFGTRQSFTMTHQRIATISQSNGGKIAYHDHLSGREYLDFLKSRLSAIRVMMADDASIYVHIDCKVGHYVKCAMDEVFGCENFVNDITRIKCNPKNFARSGYGNVKDMILFYGKTRKLVWNDVKQIIEIPVNDTRFKSIDADGRQYTTTPLHAPGETANGPTGKPWRRMLPPSGRHWRYPPSVLDGLDKRGLIEWSSTGNPRKKVYADDVERSGVKIQDIWVFKDPQNPKYPTEKNIDMLKLIISNSSKPGDIVLDAFCGSATTLVVADELGRRWIGIDSSREAISVAAKRLRGYKLLTLAGSKEGSE